MKPVVTASDLERIADGGELGIASDALITPLARDEAARRRITLKIVRDAEDKPIAGVNPTVVAASCCRELMRQGEKLWRLPRITAAMR